MSDEKVNQLMELAYECSDKLIFQYYTKTKIMSMFGYSEEKAQRFIDYVNRFIDYVNDSEFYDDISGLLLEYKSGFEENDK